MIHLDTHIFVALHDGEPVKMARHALRLLGSDELVVSPFVLFETELIKHRTHISSTREAFARLHTRLGLELASTPLVDIVDHAIELQWTREPMDRLIVAHAMSEGARLLTSDVRIRTNFSGALW